MKNLMRALSGSVFLAWGLTANAVIVEISEGSVVKTCETVQDARLSASGAISVSVTPGCLGLTAAPPPAATNSLTVSKSGSGTGVVTGTPGGISCGTACTATYETAGTQVTLTATPSAGSVLNGFTGCDSSPSPLTCAVSVTGAKSVTAAFGLTTPISTGEDPGTPLWQPNPSTYVFDRGFESELYVPRCVPNQYSGCRYGGRSSQFDTMRAGEVWSMRVPFTQSNSLTLLTFLLARAETGEAFNNYEVSMSTVPGDFNVPAGCYNAAGGKITVYDATFGAPKFGSYCPLTQRNTMYYFNIRAIGSSAPLCGTSATTGCRMRIVIPFGMPFAQ